MTHLHHEGVWRVHKVCQVPLGCTLQTELAVCGHRVVHENNRVGKAAVVQDLSVIVAQLVLLCLETKLVLVSGAQPMHGAHLVWAQGFAEQVNG